MENHCGAESLLPCDHYGGYAATLTLMIDVFESLLLQNLTYTISPIALAVLNSHHDVGFK